MFKDPTSVSQAAAPTPPTPPCGCQDPVEGLKQMFVDYFQGKSLAAGRDPATRPVFLRLHGVAHGTFRIESNLPEDLRIGVFGQRDEYPVWVRFSSDVQPGNPDLKGTVGIGIKLFGVEGEKIMAPDQGATTHDFILQNHDVFFVDTARDMCEFTCASLNGQGDTYLKEHPGTQEILDAMEKVVPSVLTTPYWSGLPARFGDGRYVKYKLEPEVAPAGATPDYNDPFYLRSDLYQRLQQGEARYRFMVQFQTNDAEMPLDRATVRWSEEMSPPIHVATLILPRQDLSTRGQATYGENLAFNTWHALPEHAPVGSIADARKVVYRASAQVRRDFNGVPQAEPVAPRPAEWKAGQPYPAGKDTVVVRAAIHPAIGIARVGNSRYEYFIGPEVVNPAPAAPGFYRDASGALKRQAARFRIYGYNAAGEVVRELTSGWADIRWTVHVANRKAAWYQWQMALDVPEAADVSVPLRNAKVKDRNALLIDGGPRAIAGAGQQGEDYEFRGTFMGDTEVYLGEIRTDEVGRLLFLGGHGVSASPSGSTIYNDSDPNGFINADGWYDDMSDGPVTAEVAIEGRAIPVDPAWVVTAPPNYGPGVLGVRTLYDLLVDLYVQAQWLPFPEKPSFRHDVYPMLQRLSGLQWVNQGYAVQFGRSGPFPFEDPEFVARLGRDPQAGSYDLYGELRRQILNAFRDPAGTDNNQLPWPWIYGDAMATEPIADTPRQNASVSPTQYGILQEWAAGNFVPDWEDAAPAPSDFGQVALPDQPAMLDRAALDHCLADAFHPGCEVTWPVRHLTMYAKPFRFHHRPPGVPEPSYDKTLNQTTVLARTGPLHAQGPGDLTRWMGLPWQADTAYCRSGYDSNYDPFVPTFWPARVPNQVLTAANYQIAIDDQRSRDERLAAFAQRYSWNDPLHGTVAGQMEQMVRIFGDMGLLEARPGVADDPVLPPVMLVAAFGPEIPEPEISGKTETGARVMLAATPDGAVPPAEQLRRRAVAEAGWKSDEERRNAPLPVRHPKQK